MVDRDVAESSSAHGEGQTSIREARLIFTTCICAGIGLLRSERCDAVLINKAAGQTKPEILIPLTKGCERTVLVGDHAQLHAKTQKHAVIDDFDIPLFERHYNMPDTPVVAKVMLDT